MDFTLERMRHRYLTRIQISTEGLDPEPDALDLLHHDETRCLNRAMRSFSLLFALCLCFILPLDSANPCEIKE